MNYITDNLNKDIKNFIKHCDRTENLANLIGKKICKAVKPVIDDIDFAVGWEEHRIDTVCFFGYEVDRINSMLYQKVRSGIFFETIIGEIFPTLRDNICCPQGMYVSQKERSEIINIFNKLEEE